MFGVALESVSSMRMKAALDVDPSRELVGECEQEPVGPMAMIGMGCRNDDRIRMTGPCDLDERGA